ncbi:zf-TFIIB domain-containing protein [Clostridium cuniculi]|nr:zf-TFIIB domain-containing protein [Clostridium cuniculi]
MSKVKIKCPVCKNKFIIEIKNKVVLPKYCSKCKGEITIG